MTAEAREALVRLAQAVSWMDRWRWGGDQPDNVALRMVDDSGPEDRILAHWITYVTDRMRPWEDVWYDGAPIFSRVATDFRRHRPAPKDVDSFLGRYKEDAPKPGKRMRAWRPVSAADKPYRSRYPADDESISRTLRILPHFQWSLVQFLRQAIDDVRFSSGGLRRAAHRLDILTYRLKLNESQAVDWLTGKDAKDTLESDYAAWERHTEVKKRLWAALRDYRKPGRWHMYLNQCGLAWPADNFDLSQLELPGDVWNTRFFATLVLPIAAAAGVSTKGSSAAVARRIYEVVRSADPSSGFYPEQFDVSFDFAQRMCDARACWHCPFWKGSGQRHLQPADLCAQRRDKRCGMLLLATGYSAQADDSECPFCRRPEQGLCDGLIPHLEGGHG